MVTTLSTQVTPNVILDARDIVVKLVLSRTEVNGIKNAQGVGSEDFEKSVKNKSGDVLTVTAKARTSHSTGPGTHLTTVICVCAIAIMIKYIVSS